MEEQMSEAVLRFELPRKITALVAALIIALGPGSAPAFAAPGTATPIRHLVVVFQENVSFDHYFGTYPNATNPAGEPSFRARRGTPTVNSYTTALMTNNPNLNPANGTAATNPFRLDRSQAVTADQNHGYTAEQKSFNAGLLDLFPVSVGSPSTNTALNLAYYDGNTVTALWNYAQHFAMSDNSYSTTFGPSTPGALNLISGNTSGATLVPLRPNGSAASPNGNIWDGLTTGAIVGDPRPGFDDCVVTNPKLQTTNMVTVAGKNVGDLLNAKGITWGWFQGGFAPTGVDSNGRAVCGSHHAGLAGDDFATTVGDYIPHHEPFEYYAQTTNQHHLRPSSVANIGQTDQANHQYDVTDFFDALKAGHLPAVSYLKAGAYQDGHAGYSDPIDEQIFVVGVINALMQSKEWKETAVIIAYDDSDGWYDHQMGPIVMQSHGNSTDPRLDDQLIGPGNCGTPKASDITGGTQNGRCGYGP